MKTTEDIKKFYREKYEKFGDDPRSLLWKSKGAAHQRFRQFWSEIDFSNKKILDIGCGFGEFGNFLVKRYDNVDYTGIDIVSEFIETGKKKYPGLDLKTTDFTKDEIEDRYDVVIASGVMNSNFGEDNFTVRQVMIKKMFSLTNGVLAFNMLGGHPQPENSEDSNVWYADSLEVLKFCLSLTRRVILRAHYNPKDFTVFMYKTKR